jgi:DNA helicase II / ATP-dependent DNA helicase PcrA
MSMLSNEQRAVVLHPPGAHALVLAVAGSGKTTTMAHRLRVLLADRGVPASALCVLMFNALARDQFTARARALGLPEEALTRILTFHAFAYRELRAAKLVPPQSELWTGDREELARNTMRLARDLVSGRPGHAEAAIIDLDAALSAVSLWKGELIPPERAGYRGHPLMPALYAEYERQRLQRGGVTFDDFIPMLLGMEAVQERLRERARALRYVIVDEYQDVNLGQQRLIEALVGPDTELMVVGDDDQTINEWRGARADFIWERLPETFRTRPVTTYTLSRTFRFGPRLALAADALIAHNEGRHAKQVLANDPSCETRVEVLVDHSEQATSVDADIAERIQQLRDSYSRAGIADLRGRIAVLGRFFSQLAGVEAECIRRRIPYRVVGRPPFLERHEIRGVLGYLRVADAWESPLTEATAKGLLDILNFPNRKLPRSDVERALQHGIVQGCTLVAAVEPLRSPLESPLTKSQRATLEGLGDRLERLHELLHMPEMLAGQLLGWLVQHVPFDEHFRNYFGEGEESVERQTTLDFLVRFAGGLSLPPREFLAFVDGLDPTCGTAVEQQVLFTSIFRTKGLEFDHVFIPQCVEGVTPALVSNELLTYDTDPPVPPPPPAPSIEVERRLFYVGMTRAMHSLTIGTAEAPRLGNQQQSRSVMPSRFVAELHMGAVEPIVRAIAAAGKADGAPEATPAIAALRAELGDAGMIPRLLDAAESWYLRVAAAR